MGNSFPVFDRGLSGLKLKSLSLAVGTAFLLAPVFVSAEEKTSDLNSEVHGEVAGAEEGSPVANSGAPAGEADAIVLKKVTVTAERRESDLQKTAVAVSAIGQEQLQERHVQTLNDLAGQAAGVTLPGNYINQSYVFIRGIGSSRPAGNPSVGIYIDDVYLARQFANTFINLPDIKSIEVLRGPQGHLYGQNISSGAVKINSLTPTNKSESVIDLRLGSNGTAETRSYLAGALKEDVLLASVAVTHRQNDGYYYNYTLDKDVNRYDTTSGRVKLVYKPTSALDITLAVDETRDQSANATATPRPNAGAGIPVLPPRTTLAIWDTSSNLQTGGQALTVAYKLSDELTVKSISAHRYIDDDQPWVTNGRPDFSSAFRQYIDNGQFSQEFQISGNYQKTNFVLGLAYFDETFDIDRHSSTNNNWTILQSYSSRETVGLFGQATWKPTEKLGLTLGGRASRERYEQDARSYASNANRDVLTQNFRADGYSLDDSSFTPKITVDYAWTPSVFSYITASQGLTSGGWNPAPNNIAVASVPVKPEEVNAYEIGLKTTLWDGRAQANLAVFYNDYTNYQTNLNDVVIGGYYFGSNTPPAGVPHGGNSLLSNADQAHTQGAELEVNARLTRDLQLGLVSSFLQTNFDNFLPAGVAASNTTTDFTGNELANAPRWSHGINGNYDLPATIAGGYLRLNLAARYTSSYFTDAGNTKAQKSPAQTYVDTGLFWTNESGRLTTSLTVKNLLDETYATLLSSNSTSYNAPRQWLLGLRYSTF